MRVETVLAVPTAIVRDQTTLANLPATIFASLDKVWAFLRGDSNFKPGRNVVLYDGGTGDSFRVEIGVEVAAPFNDSPPVFSSFLPAGRAVSEAFFGPYTELYLVHRAVRDYCQRENKPLAGPSWEVYGHWNEDPAQLRTDVFYLLQPE